VTVTITVTFLVVVFVTIHITAIYFTIMKLKRLNTCTERFVAIADLLLFIAAAWGAIALFRHLI
jgi:hypothetical protein